MSDKSKKRAIGSEKGVTRMWKGCENCQKGVKTVKTVKTVKRV